MISVSRTTLLGAAFASAVAPSALHALELKSSVLKHEHTDYSSDRGERDVTQLELGWKSGDHTVLLDLAHGRRDFGGDVHEGERVAVHAYHAWNGRWSGRSLLAYGSDDAVFANRQFGHHVNYKAARNVVLHGGATWSAYHGDVHALAWQGGASIYNGPWTTSVRYTHYDLSNRDDGHSFLMSVRRRDAIGHGSTQLWLGQGTSAFAYDAGPELRDTRSKSVSLRRVQPITEKLRLDVTVGRTWHDSAVQRYHGTSGRLGLSYHW